MSSRGCGSIAAPKRSAGSGAGEHRRAEQKGQQGEDRGGGPRLTADHRPVLGQSGQAGGVGQRPPPPPGPLGRQQGRQCDHQNQEARAGECHRPPRQLHERISSSVCVAQATDICGRRLVELRIAQRREQRRRGCEIACGDGAQLHVLGAGSGGLMQKAAQRPAQCRARLLPGQFAAAVPPGGRSDGPGEAVPQHPRVQRPDDRYPAQPLRSQCGDENSGIPGEDEQQQHQPEPQPPRCVTGRPADELE